MLSITKTYLIALSFLILGISACTDAELPDYRSNDLCGPQIMAYHFGVETLPIPKQIRTLDSLNLDGMILQIETHSLPTLDEYYKTAEVKNQAFRIFDVFTSINLDNAVERETQLATIESIYKKIQKQETVLQVLFHGSKNSPNATAVIAQIADIGAKYGKTLVIYPHAGLAIETAEQALTYIKETKKDNVYLALHLCHELAAGNGARIQDVINKVAPYIKSASISGAVEAEMHDNSLPLWFWGIKPLYMGTYNLTNYFQALYNHNYKGPIAIHTWGIKENFGLGPQEHLPKSREVLLNLAAAACK